MSDSITLHNKLRGAELNMGARSRIVVDTAVAQLNEIIQDFPQSDEARTARAILRRYEYAEPASDTAGAILTDKEAKVIETIDRASSWDIPALIEIERQIPTDPTAAFPVQLANSIRRLLDHVASALAKKNGDKFFYVVRAIAQKRRYKDSLGPLAERMASMLEREAAPKSADGASADQVSTMAGQT